MASPPDFTIQRQAHCVLLDVMALACWTFAFVTALASGHLESLSMFRRVLSVVGHCFLIVGTAAWVVRSWRKYRLYKRVGAELERLGVDELAIQDRLHGDLRQPVLRQRSVDNGLHGGP